MTKEYGPGGLPGRGSGQLGRFQSAETPHNQQDGQVGCGSLPRG